MASARSRSKVKGQSIGLREANYRAYRKTVGQSCALRSDAAALVDGRGEGSLGRRSSESCSVSQTLREVES
jgi:hypothetical protein